MLKFSAAHTTIERDPQAPHGALVGAHGEHPFAGFPIESAPVRVWEGLPQEAREGGHARDVVGLSGERRQDLRGGLVEPRDALGLGEEGAPRDLGEENAFAHGVASRAASSSSWSTQRSCRSS